MSTKAKSHEESKVFKPTQQEKIMNCITEIGKPMTRLDIANEADMRLSSVCARVNELLKDGRLEVFGVKLCQHTQKTVETVWLEGVELDLNDEGYYDTYLEELGQLTSDVPDEDVPLHDKLEAVAKVFPEAVEQIMNDLINEDFLKYYNDDPEMTKIHPVAAWLTWTILNQGGEFTFTPLHLLTIHEIFQKVNDDKKVDIKTNKNVVN